jgi:hypothetical protein
MQDGRGPVGLTAPIKFPNSEAMLTAHRGMHGMGRRSNQGGAKWLAGLRQTCRGVAGVAAARYTRNQPLGEVLLLIRCRPDGERLAMKFMVEVHAVTQNRSQACAAST